MITPASIAFGWLVLHLHAPLNCEPPHVRYSSQYIDTECQKQAMYGYTAKSCYDRAKKVIIMPDGPLNEALLWHEMDRYVEETCLGRVFTDAEPHSVIDAEGWAP